MEAILPVNLKEDNMSKSIMVSFTYRGHLKVSGALLEQLLKCEGFESTYANGSTVYGKSAAPITVVTIVEDDDIYDELPVEAEK